MAHPILGSVDISWSSSIVEGTCQPPAVAVALCSSKSMVNPNFQDWVQLDQSVRSWFLLLFVLMFSLMFGTVLLLFQCRIIFPIASVTQAYHGLWSPNGFSPTLKGVRVKVWMLIYGKSKPSLTILLPLIVRFRTRISSSIPFSDLVVIMTFLWWLIHICHCSSPLMILVLGCWSKNSTWDNSKS